VIRRWIRSHSVQIFICLVLVLIIIVPYSQTSQFKFVHYDDDRYIFGNNHIQSGFDRSSVSWAFATFFASNWQPLTWLSLMLDYKMYGTSAGGYHVTNVLIHLVNTLLLFLILSRMTGGLWKSGFVAALFAVHPLHVESVAWIMERKDVLCAMFWMLTMAAYAYYADDPSLRRYVWVLVAFVLGLMSKPMIVTLPLVLLLLDFWPLRRLQGDGFIASWRLILEKIPLIALSVLISAITIYGQDSSGALKPFADNGLSERVVNAVISYAGYMAKMLWPVNLACFYPYPTSFPTSVVLLSAAFLGVACFFSLRYIRTAPYLAMGWLWYLITLLPVCGIIQVGDQAMADRYTYIPLIGLFIAIAWGIPDLLNRNPYNRQIISAAASATLLILVILTFKQVGVWKDSRLLFEHAIAVTEKNYVAHHGLAMALSEAGHQEAAMSHMIESLRLEKDARTINDLGVLLMNSGQYAAAEKYFLEAAARQSIRGEALNNLGASRALQGKLDEAVQAFEAALRQNPQSTSARNNLKRALIERAKSRE
jgi:protein O-mannosyl-transferase